MKFIVFILLSLPGLCLAQNKVEEVQLKSGKIAILYDNGLWIFKDVSSPIEPKQTTTKLYQATPATKSTSSQTSSPCGARIKTTGAPCKRLVKGGGYCYQHS